MPTNFGNCANKQLNSNLQHITSDQSTIIALMKYGLVKIAEDNWVSI